MAEESTRRVGHDGALVADDEPVELELVEVALHRPEHPARDDHERDPGVADRAHGGARARMHGCVFRDQRAVEVARERGDVAREVVRKAQTYWVTKAATSAISWSLRRSPKAGIPPPPFLTCWTAASKSTLASSRFGPTVPVEPAAENV